jgi:1-acyl-sn-glycerol-3-phosphate acyltransferase
MSRSLLSQLWYRLSRRTIWAFAVLVYRARWSGRENIPHEGGVLIVANHQSHFDPPLIGGGCRRRINFLARATLFNVPVLGALIRSYDAIPIERDGLGLGGLKESLRRLKRGEMVLIFPEGTRTGDGNIAPLRPGFTMLAVRSGAHILPVGIEGAYAVWPRQQKFPGRGRMCVHFGPAIPPTEVQQRSEDELMAEVERRIHACHDEARRAWLALKR